MTEPPNTSTSPGAPKADAPRDQGGAPLTLDTVAAELAELRRVTGEENLDLRARIRAVEKRLASLDQEFRDRLEKLAVPTSTATGEGSSAGEAGEPGSPAAPRAQRAQRARRLAQTKPKKSRKAEGDSGTVKADSKRKSKPKKRPGNP